MIFIFGPAGSGKSTQCELLAAHLGREWRSVGELCRQYFTDYTTNGSMVPEADLARIIRREITAVQSAGRDLVFDGQPWSREGAEIMLREGIFDTVECIILLDVPRAELLCRLASRGRADDRLAVWNKKLDMYDARIAEFLAPLRARAIPVVSVDGTGSPDTVLSRIKAQIPSH